MPPGRIVSTRHPRRPAGWETRPGDTAWSRLPTCPSSQVLAAPRVGEALGDGAWGHGPGSPRQAPPRPFQPPGLPGSRGTGPGEGPGGGWLWGSGLEEHLKQQLWREKRPFHAKSSLFIIAIITNVHIPAKPAGHTLTKEPAALGQEGSGLFRPVGSNSCYGEAVQRKSKMTSLYCEFPVVLQKFLSRLTPTQA